jgi:hypothetical protein
VSVKAVFSVRFVAAGREPAPDPLRLEYSDEDYRTDGLRAAHDRSTFEALWAQANDYARAHFCPALVRRVSIEVTWL